MSKKSRICVIGLGQFGFELACALAVSSEVLAIDRKKELVEAIQDRVQHALILDVSDFDDLREAVSTDFDQAVISITGNLQASILCALHLRKIGLKKILAKAANDDHASILQAIGVDKIIFPERESARRLAASIQDPNFLDFIPLTEDYQVQEITAPAWFTGKNLIELHLRKRFGVLIIAVKQKNPARFVFLPPPELVLQPGDILLMVGRTRDFVQMIEQKST
ncbi:MAG: TrkA family potassium uptake protein [Myxococcales bacterium]|nr:TrkA family potassium uptake protein [Myxococcales bacterium]